MLGYIRAIFEFLQGVAYDAFTGVQFLGYGIRFIGTGLTYVSNLISSLELPFWLISFISVSLGVALIKKIRGT